MAPLLHVYASEVAKLIGDNPFETPDAALVTVLSRTAKWRGVVARVRQELGLLTETQVLEEVKAQHDGAGALAAGVQGACAATSDAELQKAVDAAVAAVRDSHERTLLQAAATKELRALIPGASADAAVADAAVAAAAGDPVAALRALNPQALEAVTAQVAAAAAEHMRTAKPVVEAAIVKERGTALEAAVLDRFEAAHHTKVGMRNSQRFQLRADTYVVSGYIDGYDQARNMLIEVKNRRRVWTNVPLYDLTQMRVYLAMLQAHGVPERQQEGGGAQPLLLGGRLVERFPDGSVRETGVPVCAREWDRIHAGLGCVARRFQDLTEEDVVTLVTHC
jgi:hypothetical protein